MLPENQAFDYAFLGMGCANSLLVMALHQRGLLSATHVLVLEPAQKIRNDRTFCFWLSPAELVESGLEQLISHSWDKVSCNAQPAQVLKDKKYYYLRAEVLFEHVQKILKEVGADWHHEHYIGEPQHLAKHVFDSRPPNWEVLSVNQELIYQSFYGWIIRTKDPIFDASTFTMMDFNIDQQGQAQFMYVLPFDAHTALIEPTRFSQVKLCETNASALLDAYLAPNLTSFEIVESEQGCIPMCGAQFDIGNSPTNVWPMGANAGKLKPSTGYSFVRNLRDVNQIADALSAKQKIQRKKSKSRFAFYDRLLLEILHRKPQAGKQIFSRLFARNNTVDVLSFLDEETTVWQEIKLMSSLPIYIFLAAAFRYLFRKAKASFWPASLGLCIGILLLLANAFGVLNAFGPIWILGLLLVGIPHGALDHLHSLQKVTTFNLLIYIVKYLALGALMFGCWFISAPAALLLFVTYSAWHFGEADLRLWKPAAQWPAVFLWGFFVLFGLFIPHLNEVLVTLKSMQVEIPSGIIQNLRDNTFASNLFLFCLGLFFVWRFPLKGVFSSLLLLLMAAQLPLFAAFGLYFIFQHSVNGWKQLRGNLQKSHFRLWLHALPFTLGSVLIFWIFYDVKANFNDGQAFIFLSALSFPHVLLMHSLYQKALFK